MLIKNHIQNNNNFTINKMTATKEEKDIIEIKNEIGRIRHHLDLQKKANENFDGSLIRIENALIGSNMNGNKGIVTKIDEIEERVDDLDDFKKEAVVYVKQSKFVIGAIVIALIALLLKAYFPNEKSVLGQNQRIEIIK